MSKTALIISLFVLLVAGSAGFLFYLSYGVRTNAPGSARLDNLDSEIVLTWHTDGPVKITAETEADFYSALGYAHGMNRPWAVLLSRQAALGRLGEWFGSNAWREDRLSRRLSLSSAAERAYKSLSDRHKAYLMRYADGMNAAFQSKRVRRIAPIVLLEVDPEPWEPWHAMAVERLWAWLSVSGPLPDPVTDGEKEFVAADQALRTRLHVFGSNENATFLIGGGSQLRHLFRYLTGDSGQPVFQVFSYSSSLGQEFDGISIPGTFMIPAGRGRNGSWTYLMNGEASIVRDSLYQGANATVRYERLADHSGNEQVVTIEHAGRSLALSDDDDIDSTRTLLQWDGLKHATDTPLWLELPAKFAASFSLISSDGIVSDSTGRASISGSPATAFRHASGLLFATNSNNGSALVERLQEIIAGQSETQSDWELMHDTYSTTAREWNGKFLTAHDSVAIRTVRGDEAIDYLRNWDLNYRGSSIAASIAESTDRELRSWASDSLSVEQVQESLNRAVLDLTGQFGPDMRKWRWETIQAVSLYYPGWNSVGSNGDRPVQQFHREFGPVSVQGGGHPSTLGWGPGLELHWRKASSAWEGLFSVRLGGVFEYERPIVQYTSFLGRFLAENHARVTIFADEYAMDHKTTRLTPSR